MDIGHQNNYTQGTEIVDTDLSAIKTTSGPSNQHTTKRVIGLMGVIIVITLIFGGTYYFNIDKSGQRKEIPIDTLNSVKSTSTNSLPTSTPQPPSPAVEAPSVSVINNEVLPSTVPETYLPKTTLQDNSSILVESMFGYSIVIPADWFVENDSTNYAEFRVQSCKYGRDNCAEQTSFISFKMPRENPKDLGILELAQEESKDLNNYGEPVKSSITTFYLDGKKAARITAQDTPLPFEIILVPIGSKVLHLFHPMPSVDYRSDYEEQKEREYERILASFKWGE